MSDALYHRIVRPCGVYRAGGILEDAKEIARRVRNGEVERQVLEHCFCIRCQYALEMLDKEMRP